PLLK
ncbi:DNA topoisomerase type I, partial [Monkeypox virus]